jgi:cation diffusion facilitator family transporter
MHTNNLQPWQHAHTFGQEARRSAEGRTLTVVGLTGVMMVAEIAAGFLFGSMALLADGLHMASHATALGINAVAYAYARRHAGNPRFSFGTGKVNALGGFAGAILLATFAAVMALESVQRLFDPTSIAYNQAILVAVLGLMVNGISVFILGVSEHTHDHGTLSDGAHDHDDEDSHIHEDHHKHGDHRHHEDHAASHQDHNLRSAYLHVLADALTSVLAIVALLGAKYLGLAWADPAVGIVGAILVARWAIVLLGATSDVLLDRQGPAHVVEAIIESVESDGDSRVADPHLWSIGPGIYAAILKVVAHNPASPEAYKARIPLTLGLEHVSVEVCACAVDSALCERTPSCTSTQGDSAEIVPGGSR